MANPYARSNGSIIIPINTTGGCLNFKSNFLQGCGNALMYLRFQGGMGPGTSAVVLDDVFEMQVLGCYFEHLDVDNGLLAISSTGNSCNRVKVRDCGFKLIGSQNSGVYGRGNGINFLTCSDSEIIDTFVESCGDLGIVLGGGENKVRGGFIDLNNVGIGVYGPHNYIQGTSVKLNNRTGISVAGGAHDTYIGAGAKVMNNNQSDRAGEYGIKVEAGVKDLVVNDVTVQGPNHRGSIYLYNAAITGSISNCRLRDSEKIVDPHCLTTTSNTVSVAGLM
ncbi:hypothetical protein ACP26L_36490 (plasmid) [Paenibacillus sp. S-38]|uniref:hypothetical protein n=1 Tax=Paenibacillus sp. S-38 TaxID=3416710 RepID=UPI003CE773B8